MIYLDHHAATPTDPRVLSAMDAARSVAWANPSSIHGPGRASRALLEQARERIAKAMGASPADIVLTSGGTEACNLGVLGALFDGATHGAITTSQPHQPPSAAHAEPSRAPQPHAVTTRIEHPAVLEPLRAAAAQGSASLAILEVPQGRPPAPEELPQRFRPDTRLLAVQWVNHETGTILPVRAYAEQCRARRVLCFVDATQALGKLPIDLHDLGADLVAFAAHKVGGPAGAGALWIRRGLQVDPQLIGGAQERGRRAGSADVLAQVGFGAACELLAERLAAQPRIAALRDHAQAALEALGGVPNATGAPRVATVTSSSWRGWRGEALVAALDLEGVAASSGAACSSGKSEPSSVLLAMHPDESWRAGSALRLSFGPETTEIEVKSALAALRRVLARPPA